MSWTDIRDEILEELKDKFVIYLWNGIPNDNSGKKTVAYLSPVNRAAFGKEFALACSFIDKAKHFDNAEDAYAFLAVQDELRPHPLSKDWKVDTVADVTLKTGGPCATHGALFGRTDPQGEVDAPSSLKM